VRQEDVVLRRDGGYHLAQKQLPGCCFPPAVEKTYDRSFERFVKANGG